MSPQPDLTAREARQLIRLGLGVALLRGKVLYPTGAYNGLSSTAHKPRLTAHT